MLRSFQPGLADIRALLRLAGPIVAVQVGGMLMGVVDTMVMGHVSASELAATALGNLYYFGLNGFGMGIVWAIDPIVSQAMGARDHERAALGIQRGIVLGLVLGVIMCLLCLPAGWVFSVLRQPAAVVPRATAFVHTSAPSLIFMLTYITLRQCLQAMKHTESILRTVIVGNVDVTCCPLIAAWIVVGLAFGGLESASHATVLGALVAASGSFDTRRAIAIMKFAANLATPAFIVVWAILLDRTNAQTAILGAAAVLIVGTLVIGRPTEHATSPA